MTCTHTIVHRATVCPGVCHVRMAGSMTVQHHTVSGRKTAGVPAEKPRHHPTAHITLSVGVVLRGEIVSISILCKIKNM